MVSLEIDLLTETVLRTLLLLSPFRKERRREKEKRKNFRNYLEDMLKSSYLCIRFLKRKAVKKEAIFEEFT